MSLEVDRARAVIAAEQRAVLSSLRRLQDRRRRLDEDRTRLVLRGKAAGVPVTSMATALGCTRQHVHELLREAEAR